MFRQFLLIIFLFCHPALLHLLLPSIDDFFSSRSRRSQRKRSRQQQVAKFSEINRLTSPKIHCYAAPSCRCDGTDLWCESVMGVGMWGKRMVIEISREKEIIKQLLSSCLQNREYTKENNNGKETMIVLNTLGHVNYAFTSLWPTSFLTPSNFLSVTGTTWPIKVLKL